MRLRDPQPDPADLLDIAVAAALDAGRVIAEGRGAARTRIETKSSLTDMVTEIDRAAEALILARIVEARPYDAVLGEEGAAREGTSGLRWVVDPLDGTTNYLYGLPAFAVSIAIEDEAGALVGVVHDVARGETFSAVRGGGATLDGRPIKAATNAEPATALVGTGFGYSPERRRLQAAILAGLLPAVRDIRRGGSAAIDLCSVACGRLDAHYEQGLQPWDWAAGALIAAEAGASVDWVRMAAGAALEPPILVVANAALGARLAALLEVAAAVAPGRP